MIGIAGLLPGICAYYLYKIIILNTKPPLNTIKIEKTELNKNSNFKIKENKKVLLIALICLFLGSLIVSQIGATYMVYLAEKFKNMGIKAASYLFSFNSLIIIFFQTPFINTVQKFNKTLLAGIGGFLLGFGMLILTFSSFFSIAILACLIYTLGEMLFFSAIPLICYQVGRPDRKGYNFGLYQMIYAASTIAGPGLGGYVYHNLGKDTVWYMSGAIGLLCFLICAYYKTDYNENHLQRIQNFFFLLKLTQPLTNGPSLANLAE